MIISKKTYNDLLNTIKDLDNENNKLHSNLIGVREFYNDQKLKQLEKIKELTTKLNEYKTLVKGIKIFLESNAISLTRVVKGLGIVNKKDTVLKAINEVLRDE
jgi:hypothetical protein